MCDFFDRIGRIVLSVMFPSLEQTIAIGTFTTAAIGVFIAYRQHKFDMRQGELEEQRLANELFDRRFEIFEATQELLITVVRDANCGMDSINKFTNAAQKSYFVFDDEIYNYLEQIRRNAIDLSVMNKARESASDPTKRAEYSGIATTALKNLIHEFEKDRLLMKFKPYLRLTREKQI